MKKETIFKHELNESSQAKATLNCLSNRNKKHLKESIGEVYPDSRWGEKERLNGPNGMSKSERDILIKLEQIMPNLVQKAMSKTADHDNPDEIKKLVLNMIMQGNLMQKLGDKVGASWKEFSMGFKSEIINLVKSEFAKHEEQEESFDDTEDFISNVVNLMEDEGLINNNQWDAAYYTVEAMVQSNPNLLQYPSYMQFLNVFADDILSKLNYQEQEESFDDAEDFISNVVNLMEDEGMIDESQWDAAYYTVEEMIQSNPELKRYPSYMQFINVFGDDILSSLNNQEQEETSLDTEYFSDLEEQEAYYENFRAIAELVADQIDRENGKYIDNNMDTLFAIVREVWNNNPDDLYIWDFDDVQEDDCYKFFDKHYEEIKNEYLKREHNNIMDATHDDLFDGMMNN